MNRDFRELLSTFNAAGVEYLVVGAHALAAHGHVRATKGLDVWVRADTANAARVLRALQDFGTPVRDLEERDLAAPGLVFQIGVPPVRIDVLTSVDGLEFGEAWSQRITADLGELPVPVLSRAHLIRNKRASVRLQDLADVEWLEGRGEGRR